MKKSHLRLVQFGSILTLPVAIGWLLFQPGFEPVLAVLTSITAIVSTLFMRPEEQDKDKLLPLTDECESVAEIQLDSFDVGNAETGSGGVEDFLKDYQVYFGGRHDEMAELDAWLTQPDKPFGLLVAPAGMGKSALVANWKKQLEDSGTAVVVYHPISLRYGTNSQRQTLRSLLIQMSDAARKEAALEPKRPIAGLALIDESFNKEELQELCFHLSIDYDNLGDGGKRDKARELIELCQRENRLDDLTTLCQERSPYRNWDAAFTHSGHDQLLYEPPQEGDLSSRLKENLRKPTGWNKPLVVIVDGLDELDNQLNRPEIKKVDFLSSYVGEGIHVLAVARGEPDVDWKTWRDALGWERASVQRFFLGFLEEMNVREIAGRSLEISDGTLKPLAKKIYELSEGGDPLIVSLWIDWLKDEIDNKAVQVQPLLASLADCNPGANGYLKSILTRLQPVSEAAIPLFEVLSLARGPLMANDLLWLGVEINFRHLNELVNLSGRLIIKNAQEGYVFSHTRIRQAVQDKYVPKESTQRHYRLEQFHRYGRCALKQAKNAIDGKMPTISRYLLNYYAEHLQEDKPSGYEASLYALVDEGWMQAHYAATSSYERFLADVQRAWMTAEKTGYEEVQSDQQISTIGIQVQCVLVASSIATLLGNLPPALPAMLLVGDKQWTPNLAIQYASLVPDTLQRIRTRLALLQLFCQKDEFEQHLGPTVSSTLDDLRKFTDQTNEELRARLLLMVFPFLTEPYHINDAVEQARSLRSIAWRVRLWGNLVKHLPTQEEQIVLLAETLRACAKVRFSGSLGSEPHEASEEMEPYVLGAIAVNLPLGILDRSLQIAFDVSGLDENSRQGNSILEGGIQLLRMLAQHVPECISEEFLQTCLETKQMDSSMGDSISVTIIHLAPRLSQSGILTAYKHLADKVERYKEGDNFGLGSGIRALTQSYFVAMIVLAHFSLDTEVKKKIGKLLEEKLVPLRPSPDPGLWGIGTTRYHTILTLYKTVFMGETDEEMARRITFGEIEIMGKDYPLFCLLGPKSMKAIIEQLYAKGEITNLWGGQGIRSSPYYLAAVATQLPDENLDWIMKIAGGNNLDYEDYRRGEHFDMEEWGRLRAIASVADRLLPEQCQDYAQFVIEKRLFSFDSSLEAIKSLAHTLPVELVESLIQGYDWRNWLLLEQVNDLLNPEVRAVVQQKLYTDLQKTTYNNAWAQPLVVLSAGSDAQQSKPIHSLILDKASFIADLPARMETVSVYSTRVTNKSRHWRRVLNRQVREEALALTTSTYPTHILSHLSFMYRVKVLCRFRRETAHISGMLLSRKDILKLAIVESNKLRQIMQFVLLVFTILVSKRSQEPKYRFSVAHWFNRKLERFEYSEGFFSLQGWIGDISVTNKITMWVAGKWLSKNGSDQEVDDVDETNRYKTFLEFVLPDIENIDDKSAVEQRDIWSNFYSALRSLGHKSRGQMDFGRYRQIMRQYGPDIWYSFPRELYEAALQAVVTDEDGDGEHRNNLLALLPGIAAYCPDMLPKWREQISHFWRPTNKAILLTAVGNYLPQKEQRDVIEEALNVSMKDHDRNDGDWSCGLILQEVAQYAEDSLLPFVAQCFVKYHKRDSLSEPWRDAVVLMSQRIGTRMELIEILWPLIQKIEDYRLAAFIKTIAPNLDREYVTKLLILTSELDTQNNGRLADAYVSLRTRWRELEKDDGFVIWCDFLHKLSALARADFLRRIGWFSGVVEDLGGQGAVEQVGDSILEVGQWQWHSSRC